MIRPVEQALRALGKRNLLLSIQDASFPSAIGEETGRGTPYSRGGHDFLRFAKNLGFSGILFGPQGQTSDVNASPYDGTIFSKNVLSIALAPLAEKAWAEILDRQTLQQLIAELPESCAHRVPYRHVFKAQRQALWRAFHNFSTLKPSSDLRTRFDAFCAANRDWLERDAGFEALLSEHIASAQQDDREARAFYRFCQFVVHAQHDALRKLTGELGLKLYGDLAIGISHQDRTVWESLFLRDYVMGAPPSRTNPEGQPWSYPVFDPEQYGAPHDAAAAGPVLAFMRARIAKLLAEFDGLRIDHPHGLICPWVYKAHQSDPLRAVQAGARLFSSPDLPEHPALARYAIAKPEQLNRDVPRYDDHWERALSDEQIARFSILFDVVVDCVRAQGRDVADILCEVLSTQPFPLRKVMARHHMGRFRVTQKANLRDPGDGYRSENAQPADWIMVGNHDTAPIWALIEKWRRAGTLFDRARYLAERLIPDSESARRESFAQRLAADSGIFAQAQFADLFASPAENVLIFFADLLGVSATYNNPGSVSDDNWSLRVTPDYAEDYRRKLATNAALNLPLALAMAMRARGVEFVMQHRALIEKLEGDYPRNCLR